MVPISMDRFREIVADPTYHAFFLNGKRWEKDDAIPRLFAGAALKTRSFTHNKEGLFVEDATQRELEAHYRSEGKSRSQAVALATEHLQKKRNEEPVMPTDKRARLAALEAKFEKLAWMKNRTEAQDEEYHLLIGQINDLKEDLGGNGIPAPLTKPGPVAYGESGRVVTVEAIRGYALRGPGEKKDYRSLYGAQDGCTWEDKESTFFQAVFSGRHHPGLIRAAMTETVPSDGGFLVPSQTAEKIHAVALESEIVMPRAFVQPMKSNECKLPAMNIGNHSTNLYGGFTASYTAEAGTISEADPKVRSMTLNAKKLTGLIRFSSELAQDIPGGESQIINICGKGLAWYRDRAFLKGSGSGEPLGILNAGCTISVAKESGQTADTIVYENLTKMLSRLNPGSFNNAVWICQVSAIPQLLSLSQAVGTGGSTYPVLSEANGTWQMLTRPVVFTEKTEKLGDQGDIILADLSQYVIGLRSEMRFDVSIHPYFTTDELVARLIERHDGMPLWDSALTLEDGTNTVSPFVTLDARA